MCMAQDDWLHASAECRDRGEGDSMGWALLADKYQQTAHAGKSRPRVRLAVLLQAVPMHGTTCGEIGRHGSERLGMVLGPLAGQRTMALADSF